MVCETNMPAPAGSGRCRAAARQGAGLLGEHRGPRRTARWPRRCRPMPPLYRTL